MLRRFPETSNEEPFDFRHKLSGVASKESILHLVPVLGGEKLDAITNAKVQQLKLHLQEKSPKTVNNVLAR